jgi:hypothetical protein
MQPFSWFDQDRRSAPTLCSAATEHGRCAEVARWRCKPCDTSSCADHTVRRTEGPHCVACRRPMTPLMLRQPNLRSTPSAATGAPVQRGPINVWSLRRHDFAVSNGASPRAKVLLSFRARSLMRRPPSSTNGQGIDFSA